MTLLEQPTIMQAAGLTRAEAEAWVGDYDGAHSVSYAEAAQIKIISTLTAELDASRPVVVGDFAWANGSDKDAMEVIGIVKVPSTGVEFAVVEFDGAPVVYIRSWLRAVPRLDVDCVERT